MVLGRLIRFTEGENLAPIKARWLTKIFVCGDVLSFLVQSGGKKCYYEGWYDIETLQEVLLWTKRILLDLEFESPGSDR